MQHDLAVRPGSLIAGPEREPQRHECPEAAFRAWPADGAAQHDSGGYEHDQQAADVSKRGQCGTFVRGERDHGKRQSDPGRCDKPTVALERTHPPPILWESNRNAEPRLKLSGLLPLHLPSAVVRQLLRKSKDVK